MLRSLCLLFTFLLCFPLCAQIIGGEIDYRCLGNGRYEVIIHLDHRCGNSIPAPVLYCQSGSTILTADSVTLAEQTMLNEIRAYCPVPDSCQLMPGHLKTIRNSYRGVFNLDTFNACETRFFAREAVSGWSEAVSSRSHMYLETMVNRCLAPCDASPRTSKTFPPLIVGGDAYYQGTVDNSLFSTDSFFYAFAPLFEDRDQKVLYKNDYDSIRWMEYYDFPDNSVSWPGGMHMNPHTGVIQFLPGKPQKSALGLNIKIYRKINGIWEQTGSKHVEKGVEIIDAGVSPPLVQNHYRSVCQGVEECTPLITYVSQDSTFLTVYLDSIPDLKVTYLRQSKHDQGMVCWTPDTSRSGYRPFFVSVRDNACPLPAVTHDALGFNVLPSPHADRQISFDSAGTLSLSMVPHHAYDQFQSEWQIVDEEMETVFRTGQANANPSLGAGRYVVHLKLQAGTCFTRYSDTIDLHFLSTPSDPRRSPLVYPNPFQNVMHLAVDDALEIRLYNAIGQEMELNIHETQIQPAGELPRGVYWLSIRTVNGLRIERVVKE